MIAPRMGGALHAPMAARISPAIALARQRGTTLDFNLGSGDHSAREPRRAGSAAIRLGDAHDVDEAHLLRGSR